MTTRYVIRATDGETDKVTGYWSIDHDSGGYPYWGSLSSAKILNGDEAVKIIETDSELYKTNKMSDGSTYPPRMVHIGANLCNAKMKGSVIIEVVEIVERPVITRVFRGEIAG